jgi:hypothetical protein
VLLVLLAGAAVGLLNGVLTVLRDIPSFIVTLGTASVATGLAYTLTGSVAVPIADLGLPGPLSSPHLGRRAGPAAAVARLSFTPQRAVLRPQRGRPRALRGRGHRRLRAASGVAGSSRYGLLVFGVMGRARRGRERCLAGGPASGSGAADALPDAHARCVDRRRSVIAALRSPAAGPS